jgi:hypothetical protein
MTDSQNTDAVAAYQGCLQELRAAAEQPDSFVPVVKAIAEVFKDGGWRAFKAQGTELHREYWFNYEPTLRQ